MRVVGGRLRGRSILGPRSQAIRPTSDRVRETVFNVLAHAYGEAGLDARVIDLFAGTGALGIEALSRGATFAVFVDRGAEALKILRANVEALDLTASARILRRDACRLGAISPHAPFTLAFVDPPYGLGLARLALDQLRDGGWLAPGAVCVIEEEDHEAGRAPQPGYEFCESRLYSGTRITFLRAQGAPAEPRVGAPPGG